MLLSLCAARDLAIVEVEVRRARIELDQLFAGGHGILELAGSELEQPFLLHHRRILRILLQQRVDDLERLVRRARLREVRNDALGDRLIRRIETPDAEVDLDRLVLVALRLVGVDEIHQREQAGRIDRENRVRRGRRPNRAEPSSPVCA